MSKDELETNLRELLRDVLKARFEGAPYRKLARAHGYADGYMRALLDIGMLNRQELLAMLGTERQRYFDNGVVAAGA